MYHVLTADATSLSLQVSWHFTAFPEPAPHRSLLPGAGSSPFSTIIQDLSITHPTRTRGLRFLGHRSLCLHLTVCSSRRVTEAQSTGRSQDHGDLEEENHHPKQRQQPKEGFWDPLKNSSQDQITYLSHPEQAK